jgi:unsaturated rhamnogalacturonyl hydrolase
MQKSPMIVAVLLACAGACLAAADGPPPEPLSRQMANAAIERWPKGSLSFPGKPTQYDLAMLLEGMDASWYGTADGRYYQYIKDSIDPLIASGGGLSSSDPALSHDDAPLGRQLLLLYRVTLDQRYYQAVTVLRSRLESEPAASSAGLPDDHRVWLTEPFLAEYASVFNQPGDFGEITRRLAAIDQRTRDSKTAPGWPALPMARYMMALVDSVPYYPDDDPGRTQLIEILKRTAASVAHYQDAGSGLWSQAPGKTGGRGKSFASSTACVFTYALEKGVRLGYLPREYQASAQRAWRGIQSHRPEIINDPQAVGAFLLAATEMENATEAITGRGKTVLLDAWYSSQTRKNAAGQTILFHYKWDDFSNSGFSLLGHIFRMQGVQTKTLPTAPTVDNLKAAKFYVIVSPDNPSKTPQPHYMSAQDAGQIAAWVKQGGVLVMMENDPDNADITHLDVLADIFGLHFNNVLTHHVIGDQFDMGRMELPHPSAPFTRPHILYMKDTCSLSLSRGATPLFEWKGDTMMAVAHYGKGTVVAVTDPWLYNEYTDGRKLPPDYDNFAAGQEFVHWLLQQP